MDVALLERLREAVREEDAQSPGGRHVRRREVDDALPLGSPGPRRFHCGCRCRCRSRRGRSRRRRLLAEPESGGEQQRAEAGRDTTAERLRTTLQLRDFSFAHTHRRAV